MSSVEFAIGKPPCEHEEPETVEEFKNLVRRHHENTRGQHEEKKTAEEPCPNCSWVIIQKDDAINRFGNSVKVRRLLRLGGHQALALSDDVEQYLRSSKTKLTEDEIAACDEFRLLKSKAADGGLLGRLGAINAADVVKPEEMQYLIHLFLRIFFQIICPAKTRIRFCWESYTDRFGDFSLLPLYPRITLASVEYSLVPHGGGLSARTRSRLGTLLHEVVHAFVELYVCRTCEDIEQVSGHGRVWQRLSNWIEQTALRRIGVSLEIGGFDEIKVHWSEIEHWPTLEEVETEWGLE
ncbi:hypothetical protein P153DRAFT_387160 [Dothidotthia symphoricarpi CBS 119687]|uniref:SprT-like domain-containing protein n=1 Tax=Dothidotthia symphoricarpi CBS 119687 TaxID=1392245 RepID=A0A6A6AAG2_9PLEO|nr:uncharacterized protein P153DRAFT_387160 [Dothidotthia symphoricarpi CBS 119687]KAF2128203.1 hypothetical protein P153DRAFT_387160 [Dothidotthia symphoricarpi CBS 119687]